MPIMAVDSSVGAQVDVSDQKQTQSERQKCENEVNESVEVARKLSLDSVMDEEEAYENSDLMQIAAENKKESNGTVTKKQDGNTVDDESERIRGEEVSKDKEPWVNMFKNNRAANNGMQLAYFPPQIVNGEAMVQLEGKEVQDEEDKWKCALTTYVVEEL